MGALKLRASTMSVFIALAMCVTLLPQPSFAFFYTMEQMCEYWSGTGFVGDPSDCQGYGYCNKNVLVGTSKCDANLVFNPRKQACDYATDYECLSSSVQTCTAMKTPLYVSDTNNCTQYAYCNGKGATSYGSCPKGQVYNANSNTCIWGPTCPQDSICRFMKNYIFMGDPNNCGNWLQCINGQSSSNQCSDPTESFNYQTGFCQSGDVCNGAIIGSTVAPPPTDPTACADLGATDEDTYVSDGKTCYGYYQCAAKDATGIWGSCRAGLHFNPSTQLCVSPISYPCPYNRCGNLNLEWITTVNVKNPLGCKSYSYCPGYTPGPACPPNYPWFDEISQSCVTGPLTYPICDP